MNLIECLNLNALLMELAKGGVKEMREKIRKVMAWLTLVLDLLAGLLGAGNRRNRRG